MAAKHCGACGEWAGRDSGIYIGTATHKLLVCWRCYDLYYALVGAAKDIFSSAHLDLQELTFSGPEYLV